MQLDGVIERKFLEGRNGSFISGKLVFPLKCKFQDENNKCLIYDTRPEGCRLFKKDGKDCFRCIAWQKQLKTLSEKNPL
jgi:Fe-S-cluster containining protein